MSHQLLLPHLPLNSMSIKGDLLLLLVATNIFPLYFQMGNYSERIVTKLIKNKILEIFYVELFDSTGHEGIMKASYRHHTFIHKVVFLPHILDYIRKFPESYSNSTFFQFSTIFGIFDPLFYNFKSFLFVLINHCWCSYYLLINTLKQLFQTFFLYNPSNLTPY